MSQAAEGKRDNKEKGRIMQWSGRKKRAVAAVTIAALAVLVVPVLAWFFFQKSLQTVTKINEPNPLKIGAGNAQDITQLELSNIDVSGGAGHKDVVFCVYSSSKGLSYHIQLAHTTNIGFTYHIFPAEKQTESSEIVGQSENGSESISYLGNEYSFKTTSISGNYLNLADGSASTPVLAKPTGTYHDKTYVKAEGDIYGKVQPNAEPLYWKTSAPLNLSSEPVGGNYISYYVLRVSWDNTVQNNKETDMVYLMAEAITDPGVNVTPTETPAVTP